MLTSNKASFCSTENGTLQLRAERDITAEGQSCLQAALGNLPGNTSLKLHSLYMCVYIYMYKRKRTGSAYVLSQSSPTHFSPSLAPTKPLLAFLNHNIYISHSHFCSQCPQPPSKATLNASSPTWFQAVEHYLTSSKHFWPHALGWS